MYLVRSDDNIRTPLRDNNINWTVSLIILYLCIRNLPHESCDLAEK